MKGKLNREAKITLDFMGHTYRYWVEGRSGALEFWVRQSRKTSSEGVPDFNIYGGVETHRTDGEGPPNHGRCHMISDRPCWHDGSSMWASEYWIPMWEECNKDFDTIIKDLEYYYFRNFPQDKEPEPEEEEGRR